MEVQRSNDLLVLNPLIVNHLLALGFKIVRVGKSKQDEKRSVFFFKKENGIEDILGRLMDSRNN